MDINVPTIDEMVAGIARGAAAAIKDARANLAELIDSKALLNADEIARSIQPDNVAAAAIEAGRRLIEERRARLATGQSFYAGTTLATRALWRFIKEAANAGFGTRLIFLLTPFPQLNELRVKQRAMAGGHNIDTVTIHRRHRLGLESLTAYWEACDEAVLFDARTESPREILVKDEHGTRMIDRFGWVLLRHRLEALEARIPDTANY